MLKDMLVVDAVVHPYNLGPENRDPSADAQLNAVYAGHQISVGPDVPELLSPDEFFSDFPWAAVSDALFKESVVDLGVIHALPNLGFALRDVTEVSRAAAHRDANPDQFILYATVDTPILDSAISQLARQVEMYNVDGLKLYPAFFLNGAATAWRLDSHNFAAPLLSAARDMGIRNIAVHKILFLPPAPRSAFHLSDMRGALDQFGDMTFQIVHAGVAFLDETCELLARHENLYATLESTFSYIVTRPDVFERALAGMIAAAGSSRLMFASGINLMHPQPLLAAFETFEFKQATLDRYGIDQLTPQDRANILGENAIRLNGIDRDVLVRNGQAADAAVAGQPRTLQPPWSGLRSRRAHLATS